MTELYEIRTEDGKLFCKCERSGGEIRLLGKNCSISISELLQKAYDTTYRSEKR